MTAVWNTIESDPGVFSELISEFGVRGVQVEELYSLDHDAFEPIKPVYGLIFLFKYRANERDDRPTLPFEKYNNELFFASQVINNACATQAILSILLNAKGVDIGDELRKFLEFTKNFTPDLKGLAISNCELIRNAHNSFGRPEFFVADDSRKLGSQTQEDLYHFISYVPANGRLYELDGLKDGPIDLGECPDEEWLDRVRPVIQKRIERFSRSEIRFNLMAIMRNVREKCVARLKELAAEKEALKSGGVAVGGGGEEGASSADGAGRLAAIAEEEKRLEARIASEEERFEEWRVANVRRKHNYLPFLVNFVKLLHEKGYLEPMIEQARPKKAPRLV